MVRFPNFYSQGTCTSINLVLLVSGSVCVGLKLRPENGGIADTILGIIMSFGLAKMFIKSLVDTEKINLKAVSCCDFYFVNLNIRFTYSVILTNFVHLRRSC